MSLVGTLAKVAVGVMVAKGVGSVMRGASGGGGGLGGMLGGALGGGQQGGGLLGGQQGGAQQRGGGLLGGAAGGNQSGGLGGGLGGALGGALGGGGLAGGLGSLLGGAAQSGSGGAAQSGGLGGLLGGNAPQGGGAGGLGGLLDSLGGGAGAGQSSGGLGGLLNAQLTGEEEAAPPAPSAAQEDEARILIQAMINSAKSDGNLDPSEQEKILKQVGELSQEEADFINSELAKPLDAAAFIQSVPRGMEQQVYLMSLLAIDLDSQAEAQYLDQLAKGLNISNQQSNEIHQQVGVPVLYS